MCLQCFYNKWIEYLHVHLLLKITISLKLEHHFESMLNNKVGDWIKESLMFSWKITFLRGFLSGFTGKYCLLPDTALKVIISFYVKRNLYSQYLWLKRRGGKLKKIQGCVSFKLIYAFAFLEIVIRTTYGQGCNSTCSEVGNFGFLCF